MVISYFKYMFTWVKIWHNVYTIKILINLIDTLRDGKLAAFLILKYYVDLLSIIKYLSHYITFLNGNQQLQLYLQQVVIHVTYFRYIEI